MERYKHKVQYYETDKMGIVHHSNYIRWMEEARVDFLDKIGWNYAKLESEGIISPVVSVNCNYKVSVRFGQEVDIVVNILEFKGVKLILEYNMYDENGTLVCAGSSSHGFINENGHLIRLKNEFPDFYQALLDNVKAN